MIGMDHICIHGQLQGVIPLQECWRSLNWMLRWLSRAQSVNSPFHNFECLQDHVRVCSPNMHTDVKHEALNTCKCSQNITPFCNFKYLQDHVHIHSPNMCTDVCSAPESWTAYVYALKCAIHPLESVPFHNSNHDATHQTLTFHHFSTNIRSLQNSVTAGICT